MDDCEFFEKGFEKAVVRILTKYNNDKIMENRYILKCHVPDLEWNSYEEWHKKMTGIGRYKFAMFTINFKPEMNDVLEMMRLIRKCCRKKWVEDYIWCLETRGLIDNDFVGIHAHISVVISSTKNTYKCVGEVRNTFKNVVGNDLHVNVRYSNTDGAFIDYVKGISKNDTKHPESDKLFRKKNRLSDWEGRGT